MVTSAEACVATANATSSASLKRKRPPKIEIPSVLQKIQTDRSTISTPLNKNAVCFSEVGVGVSSVKGKKKFMEDTHKIVSCSLGNSNEVNLILSFDTSVFRLGFQFQFSHVKGLFFYGGLLIYLAVLADICCLY